MHDGRLALVHVGDGAKQVQRPPDRLPPSVTVGTASSAGEDVVDGAPGEQLGHHDAGFAGQAGAEEGDDVGVPELGEDGELGFYPLQLACLHEGVAFDDFAGHGGPLVCGLVYRSFVTGAFAKTFSHG